MMYKKLRSKNELLEEKNKSLEATIDALKCENLELESKIRSIKNGATNADVAQALRNAIIARCMNSGRVVVSGHTFAYCESGAEISELVDALLKMRECVPEEVSCDIPRFFACKPVD